jgi:predicted TIM-barrel fold metal-dependent hydrolase
LSFDLSFYYQMADAASLAQDHPDVTFILCHTGLPARRDEEDSTAGAGNADAGKVPNIP